MYFITNKEDLIIAASASFLNSIGARDICSISSMVKDKIISLDKKNKELKVNNKEFAYDIEKLFSLIGDLKIYRVMDSNEKLLELAKNDDISYLKKIKKGDIKVEDNEFAIPKIPELEEPTKKIVKEEMKRYDNKQSIIKELEEKSKDKHFITKEIEEHSKELETSLKKAVNKLEKTEPFIKEEIKDNINKIKKEVKDEIQDKIKSQEISIDKIDKDYINKNIEEIEQITKEDNKKILIKEAQEELEKLTKKEPLLNIEEPLEKTKKEPLLNIKEPLEKTKKEPLLNIEEPLEKTKKEIEELKDIKLFSSLAKEELNNKKIKEKVDKTKDDFFKEEKSIDFIEEKDTREFFDIDKEPTYHEKIVKIEGENTTKIHNIELENKNLFKDKQKEIENNKLDELKEDIKNIKENINSTTKTIKEETIKIEDKITKKVSKSENIVDNLLPDLPDIKESNKNIDNTIKTTTNIFDSNLKSVKNTTDNKIDNEIEKLKEEIEAISPTINKKETNEIIQNSKTTQNLVDNTIKQEENISKEVPLSIKNFNKKIIKTQVLSLDLEENAKNLNIDFNSYKMLLSSYINEVQNYLPKIKEKNKNIINMLIDAGKLLSLNSIVLKFEKILKDNNIKIVEDIEIFIKYLKDKLDNKLNSKENIISNNLVNKDIKKEKDISANNLKEDILEFVEDNCNKESDTTITKNIEQKIDEELIDITTASNLLKVMPAKKVNIDLERIHNELGLRYEIINEFLKDFLTQTKEHLPFIINDYKNKNLESLQRTAHMLKGAANNLRLETIAKDLQKLQTSTSLDEAEKLIKILASHINGLEEELKKLEII